MINPACFKYIRLETEVFFLRISFSAYMIILLSWVRYSCQSDSRYTVESSDNLASEDTTISDDESPQRLEGEPAYHTHCE